MALAIQGPITRDPGPMTLAKTSIPGPMCLATDKRWPTRAIEAVEGKPPPRSGRPSFRLCPSDGPVGCPHNWTLLEGSSGYRSADVRLVARRVVEDDVTGLDLIYQRVRPVLLSRFIGLRTLQIGSQVVTVSNLAPVSLVRGCLPPVGHGSQYHLSDPERRPALRFGASEAADCRRVGGKCHLR